MRSKAPRGSPSASYWSDRYTCPQPQTLRHPATHSHHRSLQYYSRQERENVLEDEEDEEDEDEEGAQAEGAPLARGRGSRGGRGRGRGARGRGQGRAQAVRSRGLSAPSWADGRRGQTCLLRLKLRAEDGGSDVGSLLIMRVPKGSGGAAAKVAVGAAEATAEGGAGGARPGASRNEWRRRESEMLMEAMERSRLEYAAAQEGGEGGVQNRRTVRTRGGGTTPRCTSRAWPLDARPQPGFFCGRVSPAWSKTYVPCVRKDKFRAYSSASADVRPEFGKCLAV